VESLIECANKSWRTLKYIVESGNHKWKHSNNKILTAWSVKCFSENFFFFFTPKDDSVLKYNYGSQVLLSACILMLFFKSSKIRQQMIVVLCFACLREQAACAIVEKLTFSLSMMSLSKTSTNSCAPQFFLEYRFNSLF